MEKGSLLYEGKAKKIYTTTDENKYWIEYKDDATAFNGEKKETIEGKGVLNNEITTLLFQAIGTAGIESHFIKRISETEQLVHRAEIIPLEVVVRNIVAGSLSKRTGLPEGTPIKKPIVEFYYKNDDLGDPLFTSDHIEMLNLCTPDDLTQLREKALEVNKILKKIFLEVNLSLVDFKLEFGKTVNGKIILADEISPDTCRLWDASTGEKLDKDVFRRGLGSLVDAYKEILKRLGGNHA